MRTERQIEALHKAHAALRVKLARMTQAELRARTAKAHTTYMKLYGKPGTMRIKREAKATQELRT
jgi:hypothetical protein